MSEVFYLGDEKIVLHSDEIGLLPDFLLKSAIGIKNASFKVREIHIFAKIKNKLFVRRPNEKVKKMSSKGHFELYIPHPLEGNSATVLRYCIDKIKKVSHAIAVANDRNSLIILIRSIVVKVFFDTHILKQRFPFHCSAIDHFGKSVLFLGSSNSGKSSVFFGYMELFGKHGVNPVSDDTVLCGISNGSLIGYSLPFPASLRLGTLEYLPTLNKRLKDYDFSVPKVEDQYYIDTEQVFKVKHKSNTIVSAIVFLCFSDSAFLEPIPYSKNLMLNLALNICGYKATPITEELLLHLNYVVDKIPCFRLGLSPNLEDSIRISSKLLNGKVADV